MRTTDPATRNGRVLTGFIAFLAMSPSHADAQTSPEDALAGLRRSEGTLRASSGTVHYRRKRRANAKFFRNLDEATRRVATQSLNEDYRYDWLMEGQKFWTKQAITHGITDQAEGIEYRTHIWDGEKSYRFESWAAYPDTETAGTMGYQSYVAIVPFTAGYRIPFGSVSGYIEASHGRYIGTEKGEGVDNLFVFTGKDKDGYDVKVWLSERHGYLANRIDCDQGSEGSNHLSTRVLRWKRQADVWIPVESSHSWTVTTKGETVKTDEWRLTLESAKVNAGQRFTLDIPNNVVLSDENTQDRYKGDGKGGIRLVGYGQFHKEPRFSLWPALLVGSVATLVGTGVSKATRLILRR